ARPPGPAFAMRTLRKLIRGKRTRRHIGARNHAELSSMAKAKATTESTAAVQPIELACADETLSLQMTRWLSHLRAERRRSAETVGGHGPVPPQWRRLLP